MEISCFWTILRASQEEPLSAVLEGLLEGRQSLGPHQLIGILEAPPAEPPHRAWSRETVRLLMIFPVASWPAWISVQGQEELPGACALQGSELVH